MHRFPLAIFAILATTALAAGIRGLQSYQDFGGTFADLVVSIGLLVSAAGVAYVALIAQDRWMQKWNRQNKIPHGDTAATEKKDPGA